MTKQISEEERRERSAIYHDRHERAAAGDPFPDDTVCSEFAFDGYLEYLCYEAVKLMVDKHGLKENLIKLHDAVSKGPITLSDGTVIEMNAGDADGHIVVDPVQNAKFKYSGSISIFRSHAPYVTFTKGKEMVIVGYKAPTIDKTTNTKFLDIFSPTLHVHYCKDWTKRYPNSWENHVEFRDQSFYSKSPGEGFWAMAKRDFYMDGSCAYAFMRLTVCLDDMFNKPRARKRIEAIEIDSKITEVAAEYLKRMDAANKLQRIRELVPQFDHIALGDADLYIEIVNKFTRTTYVYDDEDECKGEREVELTLLEGEGPLLTFYNSASGAAWAVVLKELDKGRIDIYRYYDDVMHSRVRTWKNGKARGPISEWGITSFIFEIEWAIRDLEEMLKEK